MKIGVIIPTRGDRPLFIKNCMLQLARQTILPTEIALMDYAPESELPDITQRYRRGYDQLRNKGLDVIAFMEDDDWYASDYLETMTGAWQAADRPDLFGTTYTIYYHMKLFAHWTFNHHQNSHALSTMLRPDMEFEWCPDYEAFTDKHLFATMNYKLWTPDRHICLGMKHGVGRTGGLTHIHKLHRFINQDLDKKFIRGLMDDGSFEFFSNYFNFER